MEYTWLVPCIWILQAVKQFAGEYSLGKKLSEAQETRQRVANGIY